MPDTKVALLTQIQSIDASLDFLPIVDVSDTTMAVSGTTKKVTLNQLLQSGNYVVVPSGSSSQPALSFNADSNTGIYSPSGDQVAISAGGSGTLTVTNSGISVAGTITASGQISSTLATGTAPLSITSTTTVTNLNADFLDGQHGSYYQNADNLNAGTVLAARMPAFSGDATSSAGSTSLTLANSGVTAGTYRSVTVDVKGRVTAGTNPTTLAGYGITDAIDTSATAQTKVGNLTVNGSGSFGTLDVTSSTIPTSVGIYKPGTKRLGLSADSALMYELNAVTDKAIWYNGAGTSTRMTLDLANGRLGVGTVVPAGKLTVDSDTGALGLNVGTSVSPVRGNLWYDTDGTGWKFQIGKWQSSAFTPQMTFQDNGNVGIGTTSPTSTLHVVGTANITGNFSAPNGDVASSIRAAASDYAGVAFDGATSGTRVTSTLTGQNIGTGDFSMWARFKVPNSVSNSSTIVAISNSSASAFSTDGAFLVTIEQTNAIAVSGYVSSTFTTPISVSGFVPNYGGQIVDVVLTRATSGGTSTLTLYLNGIVIGTSTAAVAATSVTSTYFHSGIGAGGQPSHIIYRSVLFNRALSAADVTDLIETGVNPADQWGTQTAAYSSDFSAGTNSWSGTRSTVTGNVDGVLGVNDTLRTVVDGTVSNSHYTLNATVPGMVAGKRYKVVFNYYIPSANAILNGVRLYQLTQNYPITENQTTTGSWATTSPVEFVAFGTRLDLVGTASGNITFNGNSTDEFYVKNMVLTRIGAIVDLDLTKGIGSVAYDRSTNNLDGTLNGGVSWTDPKTQPVVLEAGSISAPSLTAAGDTNTGLYFPAADTVGFTTGGTERIRIDSSGRLGIGTASPDTQLHVKGTGSQTISVERDGATIAGRLDIISGNSTNLLRATTAKPLVFEQGTGVSSMTLDASGRLGIGTATPSRALDVVGNSQVSGYAKAGQFSVAAGPLAAFDASSGGLYNYYSSGGVIAAYSDNSGTLASLSLDASSIVFRPGGTTKATLDSSGNLGLGVTPSTTTLATLQTAWGHIYGHLQINLAQNVYWNSGWKYYAAAAASYYFQDDGVHAWYSSTDATPVANGTANFGSAKMTLDASGNLGVGATPSAWQSTFKVLQFANGTAIGNPFNGEGAFVSANTLRDASGNWVRLGAGSASMYYQITGSHQWFVAGSGASGAALSFSAGSQAMTLDASGNLGVGFSSPSYKLHVNGRISYSGTIGEGADATLSSSGTILQHGNSATWTEHRFYTSGTERFRITSTGEIRAVGQGTASAPIFSRTGDTNTGLYFPAADTLALAVGGSDAIYIDSNRRVGIGVSSGLIGHLQVGGADSVYAFAVSGATKGIRFSTGADRVAISGVDNTLTASFQPLALNGSVLELQSGSTLRATIKSTGQLNLTGLAADPTGAAGDLYYSTGNVLKMHNGTAWQQLSRKYTVALNDGSVTVAGNAYTLTHNMGSQDITVSVRRTTDNAVVLTDVSMPNNTTAIITFAAAITASQYVVTVIG